MPKLLLRTTTSTEEYSGDCDCAVIEVTAELIEKIRRRLTAAKALFEQEPNFIKVHFLDFEAEYYPEYLVDQCEALADEAWNSEFDRSGMALLPFAIDLDVNEPLPTEAGAMVIEFCAQSTFPAWIRWTCYPKHTDTIITTHDITLEQLEQWLAA